MSLATASQNGSSRSARQRSHRCRPGGGGGCAFVPATAGGVMQEACCHTLWVAMGRWGVGRVGCWGVGCVGVLGCGVWGCGARGSVGVWGARPHQATLETARGGGQGQAGCCPPFCLPLANLFACIRCAVCCSFSSPWPYFLPPPTAPAAGALRHAATTTPAGAAAPSAPCATPANFAAPALCASPVPLAAPAAGALHHAATAQGGLGADAAHA